MYKQLTREQRYAIYLGLQKGEPLRDIARQIGVNASTVSREVKRNGGKGGVYGWLKAHERAEGRKSRSPGNRAIKAEIIWLVKEHMIEDQWSPKQISGRLATEGIHISHETIYRMVRADSSGELAGHCRHKMKYRRKASHGHETKAPGIPDRVSIHERPAEADGTRSGDYEMDTVFGKNGKDVLLTIVERASNFMMMEKLEHGKQAKPLADAVYRLLLPYKGELLRTITTDNGSEFSQHKLISKRLNVPVYFTDAYSAWQKGAIENTNKLIRQYIPKGTDISAIPESRIKEIQYKINNRPRQKLNFLTPKEVFFHHFP